MSTTDQDLDKDPQEPQGEAGDSGAQGGPEASAEAAKPAGTDLAREVADTKDKYLRLMAEFDNYRRRTQKESFELIGTANAKLLGKLTEVLDNFNLAFDPKRKGGTPEDFEKGIRLIHNKFKDILAEEGLEELNPVGEEFDPNVHDALMQQESETVPENKIIDVLQKGYKVKNKNLKHAKVIVSKGK